MQILLECATLERDAREEFCFFLPLPTNHTVTPLPVLLVQLKAIEMIFAYIPPAFIASILN